MDPNESIDLVKTLIEHGYTTELANTVNDVWFNVVGKRALKARIKNDIEIQKYKKELEEELLKVPKEDIRDPKMYILGPALENSKYYIDIPTIRRLFVKAAAGSFSKNIQNKLLPSYITVITQLSEIDASVLDYLSGNVYIGEQVLNNGNRSIPIMDIDYKSTDFSKRYFTNIVPKEFLDIIDNKVPYKVTYDDIFISIDNLIRLGIVHISNSILREWHQKNTISVFDNHELELEASKKHMLEINNLSKQLSDGEVKQVSKNEYESYLTIPFLNSDEVRHNINLLKDMIIKKYFKTLNVTSYGQRFCSICI